MWTILLFSLACVAVGITLQYGITISGPGVSIQRTLTRTGDGGIPYDVSLAPGKAGTLSTRTDDDTGVVTLSGGHGIATSDVVDVFWSGGRRYGMTATVATNDVTVDGGAGDAFPVEDTAVVLCKQTQINLTIDGDNCEFLVVEASATDSASPAKASVDFQDASSASIEALHLTANVPRIWDLDAGDTNAFTGNIITKALASNGSSSETLTLKICGVQDASE